MPGVEFFFFIDPASVPSWLGERKFFSHSPGLLRDGLRENFSSLRFKHRESRNKSVNFFNRASDSSKLSSSAFT